MFINSLAKQIQMNQWAKHLHVPVFAFENYFATYNERQQGKQLFVRHLPVNSRLSKVGGRWCCVFHWLHAFYNIVTS